MDHGTYSAARVVGAGLVVIAGGAAGATYDPMDVPDPSPILPNSSPASHAATYRPQHIMSSRRPTKLSKRCYMNSLCANRTIHLATIVAAPRLGASVPSRLDRIGSPNSILIKALLYEARILSFLITTAI